MNVKFGDSSLNLKVDGSLANIDRGPRGYSAYEIAVQEGFVGTEEEWLASLVGPEGKQGKDGERGIQGPRGQQGDKGDKGDTGPQGDKGDTGATGPQGDKGEKGEQGVQGIQGIQGIQGETGEKGDTGNGILSVQKTATSGLVDTYTITFTDGTTTTFDVTNGEDGEVTQAQLDESQAKQDTKIDWLQTLVNQMPHVSGQGTDLSLESVLNYRLMKFLPQGVSSQESTTGKNLLPHSIRTQTSNGVTITNNSDGTYTLNGTASATANFVFPSSDWITFNSGSYIFSSNDFDGIRYAGYYAGGTSLFYVSSNREFTLENDIERFRLQITALSGSTFNNRIIKPMIRLASITDDTYEPYTGGAPAPNPSYPYPVNNVTGENEVVISNENLLKMTDGTYSSNGITAIVKDGLITLNGTATANSFIRLANDSYDFLAGIYVLSANNKLPLSSTDYFRFVTNSGIVVGNQMALSNINANTTTTYNEDIRNAYLQVRITRGTTLTNYEIKPMFVKGSTAPTTYVEHEEQNYQLSLGNIELNSSPDGTIRDQIVGKPNEWYKREYIGKVVLDGSESGWINEGGGAPYTINIPNSLITTSNNELPNVLVDRFKSVTFNSNWNNYNSLVAPGVATRPTILKFRYTDISGLNSWKQWLSENNVTVYYLKAQYTDIPITDTTLINQLNDIYNNAHSYNGVTNITTTYEDGNEQMYLDIEALAKDESITAETDPIFSASASSGITSSDISNWNNKADVEDIPDLTDYVKNTDYATASKGGVIKIGNGNSITANGILYPSIYSYANYQNTINNVYISKGTLENVITGKNLADKNYVDTAIATAITNTLGGSY